MGEEQENIESFYAHFLTTYKKDGRLNVSRLVREAAPLLVTGRVTFEDLFEELRPKFIDSSRNEARFRQYLESKKSLDHLGAELEQRPAEQVTEEYIDTLYSQLKSLTNITTIDPRIRVDISYQNLEKEALDTTCPYILKLDTDRDKIQSEIVIQKMVNGINANITPMVIDADIKTFSNGVDNLYGFAMELIHGRPFVKDVQMGLILIFQ